MNKCKAAVIAVRLMGAEKAAESFGGGWRLLSLLRRYFMKETFDVYFIASDRWIASHWKQAFYEMTRVTRILLERWDD